MFPVYHTVDLSSRIIGCFCCAMETGVRIYNVEPLMEKGHLGKEQRAKTVGLWNISISVQ